MVDGRSKKLEWFYLKLFKGNAFVEYNLECGMEVITIQLPLQALQRSLLLSQGSPSNNFQIELNQPSTKEMLPIKAGILGKAFFSISDQETAISEAKSK